MAPHDSPGATHGQLLPQGSGHTLHTSRSGGRRGVRRNELFGKDDLFTKKKQQQPGNSAGDLFGMVSLRDPFKGFSDLQLGDEKGTLNHLELGGFLKWWYQTTMGFPTKNDHFGVESGGYQHLRKHPLWISKNLKEKGGTS